MSFQVTAVIGVSGPFDDGAASSLCSLLDRIFDAEPTTTPIVDFSHARDVTFVALAALVRYGSRAPAPVVFRGLSHQQDRFLRYLMGSADRSASALAAGPRGRATPQGPGGNRGTILVVDDDGELRGALAEILASEGYATLEARDGDHALGVLRGDHTRPDLILLDLKMPRMDGRQFRQVQLADRQLARIPVIVLSGEGIDPSSSASLVKPFEPAELVKVVASVLAQGQRAPEIASERVAEVDPTGARLDDVADRADPGRARDDEETIP